MLALGYRDHNMLDFSIVREKNRERSRLIVKFIKGANLALFKDLLRSIPWARALEGREAQESRLIFKHYVLQTQDRCIGVLL